jgi:hypothetical protein
VSSHHQEFSVVALIDSKDAERANFGSSFLIHRDEKATYWLTCAHVITDVGGSKNAMVDGLPIELVAPSEDQLPTMTRGCDLAIVRVEGFLDKKPLRIYETVVKGTDFVILGYSQKDKAKFNTAISGRLSDSTQINLKGDRTPAWNLEIDDTTKDTLQPGYSGSPVIDRETRCVIGVVTQRAGEKQGVAIAIEALRKISGDLPIPFLKAEDLQVRGKSAAESEQFIKNRLELLRQERASVELRVQQLTNAIREMEAQLISGNEQLKEALKWLEKRDKLAEQYGKYSLKNLKDFPDLEEELRSHPEASSYFYKDIEKYLELIRASLLTNRKNVLRNPVVKTSLSEPRVYADTLERIRNHIPDDFPEIVRKKIEEHINYLISRILPNQ